MDQISSFSLIIPAYNEEKRLPKTLNRVCEWVEKIKFDLEIIIIDDGSKDKTTEIVKTFAQKEKRIRLVRSEKNLGKMLEVLRGFKLAKKSVVGVMDADGAADPEEFSKLFARLPNADIVIGSRILRGNLPPISGKPLIDRIISKGFSILFRFLFDVPIYDPQIGFKIYKRKVLEKILLLVVRKDGLADTEILIKASGLGYKVDEIPINYHHISSHSKVKRIKVIPSAFVSLLSCWLDCYRLYKQSRLLYPVSRYNAPLKIFTF